MKRGGWLPTLVLILGFALRGAVVAPAQPASTNEVEDLELRPPRGEIGLPFWEAHGSKVIAASLAGILALGLGVWRLARPRPTPPVPPEVEARAALKQLAAQAETGHTLSAASQVVRRYFIAAFSLPPQEMNTREFSQVLHSLDATAPLASRVIGYLQVCDERKFSPRQAAGPWGAAARALELIELAEQRRQELAAPTASKPA
jgi:hypothetical protein